VRKHPPSKHPHAPFKGGIAETMDGMKKTVEKNNKIP
jgi:hypothetical protein